ncbi:MAG: hypothetical protein ABGX07_04590 [Pirellulaceae bacterium]
MTGILSDVSHRGRSIQISNRSGFPPAPPAGENNVRALTVQKERDMNRVALFSIAFAVINRFIFPDSSIAQLSSPNPAWTLSEMRAWDSSPPLPTGSAEKEYIEKAPAPELSPPQRLLRLVGAIPSSRLLGL